MKILHIVTGGFPGGPLKVALYQAYFSNLMGYDTYILTNYDNDVIMRFLLKDLPHIDHYIKDKILHLPFKVTYKSLFKKVLQLKRDIIALLGIVTKNVIKLNPDIIIAHNVSTIPIVYKIAKVCRSKVILYVHNHDYVPSIREYFHILYNRRADAMLQRSKVLRSVCRLSNYNK